jgi:hypothetical protein
MKFRNISLKTYFDETQLTQINAENCIFVCDPHLYGADYNYPEGIFQSEVDNKQI